MKHAYIDEYSNINSFLSGIDPRIKIITFIALIIFITLTGHNAFLSFASYAAVIIVMILLSKIPLRVIIKRYLVIIPFIFIIAVFIPFFKQGEIFLKYSLGAFNLTVTYEGILSFLNILIKASLCVLSMILLTSTTNFSDLLKAFEALRCPRLVIMIISFMYRYIFVIQDESMAMLQAKQARSARIPFLFHIKTLSNMLGVLFIRSYERSETVYLAMCARGFNGQIRSLNKFAITKKDLLFLIGFIIVVSCISFL